MVFYLFLLHNPKKEFQNIEKALPTQGFRNAEREAAEPYKTNGRSTFSSDRKSMPETL